MGLGNEDRLMILDNSKNLKLGCGARKRVFEKRS